MFTRFEYAFNFPDMQILCDSKTLLFIGNLLRANHRGVFRHGCKFFDILLVKRWDLYTQTFSASYPIWLLWLKVCQKWCSVISQGQVVGVMQLLLRHLSFTSWLPYEKSLNTLRPPCWKATGRQSSLRSWPRGQVSEWKCAILEESSLASPAPEPATEVIRAEAPITWNNHKPFSLHSFWIPNPQDLWAPSNYCLGPLTIGLWPSNR